MKMLKATLLLSAMVIGCGEAATEDDEAFEGETVDQSIVNGRPATAYTEAALINGEGFICSGSVIAPRVVLTAGHCVHGSRFTVVTPATGARATGSRYWTDYQSTNSYVNPRSLDVGIIILDTPINLPAYPPLATAAVDEGTLGVNVGRINNGQASNSSLFYGREVMLANGARSGAPLAYRSDGVIQSGDSGGPVYVGAGSSRKIVAVNSGAGGGTQVLARVDLAKEVISQLIAQNGGAGPSLDAEPADPEPPPNDCPATESEPNDVASRADQLAGKSCGSLRSADDVDWYTWNVDREGVKYQIDLAAKGDADILMWKRVSWGWARIIGRSATSFAAYSGGPGMYMIAVRSRDGATQPYSLSLKR